MGGGWQPNTLRLEVKTLNSVQISQPNPVAAMQIYSNCCISTKGQDSIHWNSKKLMIGEVGMTRQGSRRNEIVKWRRGGVGVTLIQ